MTKPNAFGSTGTAGIERGGVAAGGQQREVQFVIERDCPDKDPNAPPLANYRFGVCVWVEWPPQPPIDPSWPCAKLKYRITDKQMDSIDPPARRPCGQFLCEHMGRIIE